MLGSGIRSRATLVLFFALFGSPHLFATVNEVTAVAVEQNQIQIHLNGKPSVSTDSFGRPGGYFFVLTLRNSVLVGSPRHLKLGGPSAGSVDVTQYTLNPDVVHVVVRSAAKMQPPVAVRHTGGARYQVTLAVRAHQDFKVFLDVGHGGYDPGGTGPDGLPESFVNLSVARRVAAILKQHGIQVQLDRHDNTFVSLPRRVSLADESSANLFVGLYCNASSNRSIHGTTTYYYHDNSLKFARYLQSHVSKSLGLADNGVMKDNLYVIRYTTTKIPDVLIEYAYISNFHEEQLLSTPSFRDRIASSVAEAIINYFVPNDGSQPKASAKSGSSAPSAPPALPKPKPAGPAMVTTIETTDGTVQLDSVGPPKVKSFTMKSHGATYYVVNMENTILSGRSRSFSMGPPFSGHVTIDQYSVHPNVVRIAVREDYLNSYRFESKKGSNNHYLTTIYPMAN